MKHKISSNFRGRYLPLKTLFIAVVLMFCNNSVKAESEDFKQIWEIKKYGRAFSHFVNNQKELLCFTGNGFNLNSMEDGSFLLQVNLRNTPDVIELDETDSLVFFSQVRGNDSSGLFMHDLRTGEQTRITGPNHKEKINITLDTANDKLYFVTDSVGLGRNLLCEYDYKKKGNYNILYRLLENGTQLVYSYVDNKIYSTRFFKLASSSIGVIDCFDLDKQEMKVMKYDYLGDLNENQFDDGATIFQPKDFRLSPNGRYLTLSTFMCLVAKVYDLQEEKLFASINIGETQNLTNKQYRMFFIRDHKYMFNTTLNYSEIFNCQINQKIKKIDEQFLVSINFATNDNDLTKIVVTDDDGNTRCYEVNPRITGIETELTKEPIIIYPNPSDGLVYINLQNNPKENISIKLNTITGETLPIPSYFINGNLLSLNITTLPPATYFITINNNSYKLIME